MLTFSGNDPLDLSKAGDRNRMLMKYNKFTTNNMIKTLDQRVYWKYFSFLPVKLLK